MSGPRTPLREHRHSIEPLVIDRTPRIINRSPDPPARRASHSGTRSIFRLYNPFGRRQSRVLITERTIRRRRREGEEQVSSSRNDTGRGRPPAPPIVLNPIRSQSTPAYPRYTSMPPTQSQRGYVPLPPRIPSDEDKRSSRERGGGRDSRSSRHSQVVEDPVQVVEGAGYGRRSPRPYHGHIRPQAPDPLDTQEQVLEPSSPRPRENSPNFEIVQPNETARSRSDVYKEYMRMKQIAEYNYKVAEKASERYSSAEVRLQNFQQKLADQEKELLDEKSAHSKTILREEEVRKDRDRLIRELEELRLEHRMAGRERDQSARDAKSANDRLDSERRRADKEAEDHKRGKQRARSQERERESHESSGNERIRGTRRPPAVKIVDQRDAKPRSMPREEGSAAGRQRSPRIIQREPDDFAGGNAAPLHDPAADAIARARRETAGR